MRGGRVLCGQTTVALTIVRITTQAVTDWTAWRLGFRPQPGEPWLELAGWPIYDPQIFFWWFSYDAYVPAIFSEGAMIAVLSKNSFLCGLPSRATQIGIPADGGSQRAMEEI